MQDEIAFEHFIPPTDQMALSPPSTTASPDLSLSQHDGSRPSSRKEKSRKTRSSKQSPASEEDTPEIKSRVGSLHLSFHVSADHHDVQRRREQNRIAQRTFRERKDRYIQNLESHIKMLDASHKNLQASYRQSTDQVSTLYTQLIEAEGELEYWRCLAQPPTTPTGAGSSPSSATSPMIAHPMSLDPRSAMTPVDPNNSAHTGRRITGMPGMPHMQHGHFT
jgi:AP-1-like transcription factor